MIPRPQPEAVWLEITINFQEVFGDLTVKEERYEKSH